MADENETRGVDATLEHHMGNFLREQGSQAEGAPEAESVPSSEAQGAQEQAAPDQPQEAGTEQPNQAPERPDLVEREWYGKKVVLSREADAFLDKYFTQKNQEIASLRRQQEQALLAEKQSIEAEKAKLAQYREKLAAWAKGNPQVAPIANQQALEARLQDIASRVEAYEQSQKQEAAEQALRQACVEAETKVKLPDSLPLASDDFRRLYVAEFMDNDGQISLEEAALLVRDRLTRGIKQQQASKLQELAGKRQAQQGQKPLAGQSASSVKPMNTRELIQKHGSKAAWDHIGRLVDSAFKQ